MRLWPFRKREAPPAELVIEHNWIEHPSGHGIMVSSVSDVRFEGNRVVPSRPEPVSPEGETQ